MPSLFLPSFLPFDGRNLVNSVKLSKLRTEKPLPCSLASAWARWPTRAYAPSGLTAGMPGRSVEPLYSRQRTILKVSIGKSKIRFAERRQNMTFKD